ncbi:DUF6976 family protein [Anaeromyxobacter oryzisoli]|uniref:DUF6976 family protein n=1 Tax=Anaeromyxobacter oryzisoli TaxID=2925408 RepID=UPI001F56EB8F|nr:hypothetical protein [Anaeromyxobacter sp. SG63]
MQRHLLDVDEVATLIRRGEPLLLAGDESRLRLLPRGRWIAGTIPYFMSDDGGIADRSRIFAERLPDGFEHVAIRRYDEAGIARVYTDLPPDGMGVIVAPYGSAVHLSFARNAPRYDGFATAPLFGWISGVHLSEIGRALPRVFDGSTGEVLHRHAVVMQIAIPPRKVVDLAILNIFEKGDGPAITFPATGFTATSADVDGQRRGFAEYVREAGLDTRLPLVADYYGARINVSFQAVDDAAGEVRFFAPVFAGVRYHHARPVPDYVAAFASALPSGLGNRIAFSCNCILNYVNSSLEGRKTGDIVGPMTFGEIAYQLLNQTMVYVSVLDEENA